MKKVDVTTWQFNGLQFMREMEAERREHGWGPSVWEDVLQWLRENDLAAWPEHFVQAPCRIKMTTGEPTDTRDQASTSEEDREADREPGSTSEEDRE